MGTPDVATSADTLRNILAALYTGWWTRPDFWIATIIGVAGLIFSILAFVQARKAATAARAAARSVKIQTVTMELQEVHQMLDAIEPQISYAEARKLLSSVNYRVRRHTTPFINTSEFKETISRLRDGLAAATSALEGVRPSDPETAIKAPNAVYYAIVSSFSQLSGLIADLLGLMESETLDIGEGDADATRN